LSWSFVYPNLVAQQEFKAFAYSLAVIGGEFNLVREATLVPALCIGELILIPEP
jgi:hypothetical protein